MDFLQGCGIMSMNVDIIIYIYKLLNFKDQISLSCVNGQLHDCFVNFISKEPYRAVNIYRRQSDYAVTNGNNTNSVILGLYELCEFFQTYAADVYQLRQNFPMSLIFFEKFPNLTSYSLESKQLSHEQLELIAQCCPNLQNLEMFEVVHGVHLVVNTLMSMRNLKRLTLKYADLYHHLEYRYFREFVCKLNLDALIVHGTLIPSDQYNDTNFHEPQLKELDFRTSFDPGMWFDCFHSYLTNLKNLTSLTFASSDCLDDMNLRLLYETCTKLKFLTIQHTYFVLMKTLYTPPEVTQFAIEHCRGLSWNNFKEILCQPNITNFTSICTTYTGEFEDFSISPYIEKLNFGGCLYLHDFRSAFEGNTVLKELIWEDEGDILYDGCEEMDVPVETCPNLQTIILNSGFIPLESLMQLRHLKKLQITVEDRTPLISWSYLTSLLKHPSLTDLIVDCLCDDAECLRGTLEPPGEGFSTNIKHLSISCDIFEQEMHFWLDLLRRNIHLQLECQKYFTNCPDILDEMIFHEKFPKHISTIDIWGFTIRILDLQSNFHAVTGKLVEHHMKLHPNDLDITRIIIRRGQ